MTSHIESEYQRRIDAMLPVEKVARTTAMFLWTRQQLARQILAENGPTDAEVLKWQVALKLYGNEPAVRNMIESLISHVSR